MKYFVILLLVCNTAWADDCKTTTVVIDRNGVTESETAVVCKEGGDIKSTVKVGDVILESEVGRSKIRKYFSFRNSRCRIFTEHHVANKQLHDHYGVICQTGEDSNQWIVVDKW